MASIVQVYQFIMFDLKITHSVRTFALYSWLYIILTVPHGIAAGFTCAQVHTPLYKFEFSDPRISGPTLLGEGEFGKVELQKNHKGQDIALKTYKMKGPHSDSQLNRDYRAFKFLLNYKYKFSFHLPQVDKVSDQILRMDYYPGRTVEDLFADAAVKPEVKSRIKTKYEKMIQELTDFLGDHEFDIDRTVVSGLIRISATNDSFSTGAIDFIIKPDNVIVDPETLHLALIDPY
ncbi:MAG: hypothetical protein ACXWC9_01240 [Pseudobdellovibrionaceae bacterium]